MYETQRTGLPTWAKVLIGIVAGFGALILIAGVIGAIFMSRFVRVIQRGASGAGDAGFDSSLRWQKGVLVADVAVSPSDNDIVKVTDVSLDGVSSERANVTVERVSTLTFPFHKFKGQGGDQETIRFNYEVPNTGESGYESSTIEVPPKPAPKSQDSLAPKLRK